jgi:hypothetical protein
MQGTKSVSVEMSRLLCSVCCVFDYIRKSAMSYTRKFYPPTPKLLLAHLIIMTSSINRLLMQRQPCSNPSTTPSSALTLATDCEYGQNQ